MKRIMLSISFRGSTGEIRTYKVLLTRSRDYSLLPIQWSKSNALFHLTSRRIWRYIINIHGRYTCVDRHSTSSSASTLALFHSWLASCSFLSLIYVFPLSFFFDNIIFSSRKNLSWKFFFLFFFSRKIYQQFTVRQKFPPFNCLAFQQRNVPPNNNPSFKLNFQFLFFFLYICTEFDKMINFVTFHARELDVSFGSLHI